ncbi:ceramide kinase-like [Orbicella faveolata]|uniref:ceramide kinase-like n=1 Tax=Orbicella faveolata TaxID=48498 RepID=UPI0009E1C5F9|nr:ceramide kinase-like [Orbicella faveolata]
MANGSVVMKSVLDVDGKPFDVVLSDTSLSWGHVGIEEHGLGNACFKRSLPLSEVFAVIPHKFKADQLTEGEIELTSLKSSSFCVYAVKRTRKHKWRDKTFVFDCDDTSLCQEWIDSIQNILSGFNRPKRLLVFINPVGGKKLGRKIYTEQVQPLFELANIKVDIIVTQKANHARDYLLGEGLEKIDGVVSVGGDGMFHEVLNGLVIRAQQDAMLDSTSRDFQPVPLNIPIGIIPAGSTDAIAFCTTGNNDPITSALHIILGDIQPLDVCCVKKKNEVLRYNVAMAAYGFFGDVMQDSEKLRWMGPKRYDLSGFKKFMSNRGYDGVVTFLPAPAVENSPQDKTRCRSGCNVCNDVCDSSLQPSSRQSSEGWHSIKGRFISVIGANISCACAKSPEGLSPSAHLADGCLDLILVKHTSRLQYLRHMIRLSSKADQFNFDFVEVHRVREFYFRPLAEESELENETDGIEETGAREDDEERLAAKTSSSTSRPRARSIWNVDGELVTHPAIHIKVHRQLIRLFARGIEECEDTPSCTVCKRR